MHPQNIPRSFADLDELEFRTPSKKDRFIKTREELENLETDIQMSTNSKNNLSHQKNNNENVIFQSILEINMNQNSKAKPKTNVDETNFDPAGIRYPLLSHIQERPVPSTPFKVLDAPNLVDDFYVNILDWSSNNKIGVCLGSSCYTWSFDSNSVEKVAESEDGELLTSLAWEKKSDRLALGCMSGEVKLYDIFKKKCVRKLRGHHLKVGALSFMNNLILSGCRESKICLFDVRDRENPVSIFTKHTQEICGLKWSPDGSYFASGGNDNMLHVFSPKTKMPLMEKRHKAAVRAIDWSEKNFNVVASGGGTADQCIKIWNVNENKLLDMKNTESQVSNIFFSRKEDEIITSHGFSQNDICIWKRNGLKKTHSLTGHASRVLHLAMSPCGNYIVSGAGDETLRFWNLNYKTKPDTPERKEAQLKTFQINFLR